MNDVGTGGYPSRGATARRASSRIRPGSRQVGSSRMWFTLRDEEGIDGARSADVAAWAVETLIAALRAGGGPIVDGS